MQKYIMICLIILICLPVFAEIKDPDIEYCSYATTADGAVVGYYGEKARVEVSQINQISRYVINALISTEDRDFYKHDGVSMKGLGRAVAKTMTGSVQGGSTITMQLARNLFLTQEKTISRKLTEMKIARELEEKYTKNQILLMYLNTVYYGNSAYGIWAASQEYFSKSPDKLNIHESALIIGILNAPVAYDPVKHADKALARRNIVLANMLNEGYISRSDYNHAKKQGLGLVMREKTSGFFLEYVRLEANRLLKRFGKNLSNDIFIVETTLDSRAQRAAGNAMRTYWKEFPKSMQTAQMGLISLDVNDGAIRAMLGGNPNALHRGLNRATQIKRQPGSSFKPMLYGYLLRSGYNLATPLKNMPIVIDSGGVDEWRPRNEDKSTSPYVSMQYAIQHSVNLAAAYAVTELTNADSVASFAKTCGIESELLAYPSLALGTSDVSPLEMATAYSVFASGGYLNKPWAIVSIKDKSGRVYYRGGTSREQVLDEDTAYLMTYALQQVVNHGTGYAVRRYYRGQTAGKTGTTSNSVDAWFVGYNSELSTAIWVGNDTASKRLNASFGYGGTACAPMFGMMYQELAKNHYPGMNKGFTKPETVQEAEFCLETGMLATENCTQKVKLPFNSHYMPEYCSKHLLEYIEDAMTNTDVDDKHDTEESDDLDNKQE
ncbi:MAG TPA: PBP1A family penicillin-binding protein [Candidatus Cloacimonadota bacterium]|nr:PBP1A family penicillin-binding protein [Candidatus Cloacimonadota bacterium]